MFGSFKIQFIVQSETSIFSIYVIPLKQGAGREVNRNFTLGGGGLALLIKDFEKL